MVHAVELHAVARCFEGGGHALKDVTLGFPRGKLTTLLGPSGCGKSTMLRIIAGLEAPDSGAVLFDGQNVTATSSDQRPIGMVFQSFALFPHMNVQENVNYGLYSEGLSPAEKAARVVETLRMVGMHERMRAYPSVLSGGQQQRVALARALAGRPKVLLLDEPLSNVDRHARRHIREDIRFLQQDLALTVVYVTHDHAEAMAVSDVVVVMRNGEVVQAGPPRDVFERPINEFVASFMGDAEIFDAAAFAGGYIRLGPLQVGPGITKLLGSVKVVIRPRAWTMDAASGRGLPGRVSSRAYVGAATEYRILTVLGNLLVITGKEKHPRPVGSPVSLHLNNKLLSVIAGD